MQPMKTVSRKRFERHVRVSGLMWGGGLLFGFLLVVIPNLQMREFDSLVRPLIVGVLLFLLACALPSFMVRHARGMEPKIRESSRRYNIGLVTGLFVVEVFFLVFLSMIYHEVWGGGAVTMLIGLFVVMNILSLGLIRWAHKTP